MSTFNDWWDSAGPDDQKENPFREDSAAFWAYAGWQAARNSVIEGLNARHEVSKISHNYYACLANEMKDGKL